MTELEVVEVIEVATSRGAAWTAISDPGRYARWSPEHIKARRLGVASDTWAVGDEFVGTNKAWFQWSTTCTVVVVDLERTFAFDVRFGPFPVARWEFSLASGAAGGVRVTQRWVDHRTGLIGTPTRLAGVLVGRGFDAAAHNRETMRATLQALKEELESS
jgi:hypothetical protein